MQPFYTNHHPRPFNAVGEGAMGRAIHDAPSKFSWYRCAFVTWIICITLATLLLIYMVGQALIRIDDVHMHIKDMMPYQGTLCTDTPQKCD